MFRPRLCLDIDNCLARTDEVMRQLIRDYTRGRVKLEYEHITQFDYHKCADGGGNKITKDEWNLLSAGHDRIFSEFPIV